MSCGCCNDLNRDEERSSPVARGTALRGEELRAIQRVFVFDVGYNGGAAAHDGGGGAGRGAGREGTINELGLERII